MHHLRYALAIQLFLFLALTLPAWLLLGLDSHRWGVEVVAAAGVALYCCLRLSMLALDGSERLLSLTFWVFVYIWLAVTPMLQVLSGRFPHGGLYSQGTILSAFGVVFAGLVAYDLGGWAARGSSLPRSLLNRWFAGRRLSPSRTMFVGALGALVALGLTYRLGGFASLFVSRIDLSASVVEKAGGAGLAPYLLYMTLLRVPIFVAAYLLLVSLLHVEKSLRVWLAFIVFAVLCLMINNPFNSARYWFGMIVLSVFYVLAPWRRSWSFALYAFGTVVAMVFLFPHTDLFRVTLDPDISASPGLDSLTQNSDYDAFQQLMNSLEYAGSHGVAFGRQVLGTLLFWFPRSLWAGKPVPSGQLVAEASGYPYLNLSLPLWGEMYLDGALIAVALVFFGYGYLTRQLERAYQDHRATMDRGASLVVPLYAAFQFLLLRGALMSSFAYFTPILAILFVCTTRRDRPAALAAREA